MFKKPYLKYLLVFNVFLFGAIFLQACNSLETNIDVDLPAYDRKLVVECYITAGKPYKMLLTESVSYFDKATVPVVNFAKVYITHAGVTDTLKFKTVIDSASLKVYNYQSTTIAPDDANQPFALYIKDLQGRIVTATTKLPPPLVVDTVYYKFRPSGDTSKASITARINAKTGEENIFRFFLNVKDSIEVTTSSRIIDDRFVRNDTISTFTTYRFERGDSIWVNIYRINQEYYDFYTSSRAAFNANISPFSQSVRLKSNIEGGIGIFTAVRPYRKLYIIGK